jgi:membrane protein YdbS with pleckstrin-like domain
MKITMSSTREKFPLSTKKIIKKTLVNSMALLVLLIIFLIASVAIGAAEHGANTAMIGLGFIIVPIILVVIMLIYFYQKWYFAVYYYDLTDDLITIKKGPITPTEINIPYVRVQDVYVDQDLLDRFFGLYDVHLSSATVSSGMEAHIDGVEKTAADGLRNLLLSTVQQKISKNQNQSQVINQQVNKQ